MEGSQRRLAAILVADMVGFSRLIGADEEGTLARQKALRGELVDPTIRNHHGRVVKSTGDGFLAEFGSAVDAVRCALRIQSAMQDGQIAAAGEPPIVYRIGINVGDIVIDGDDIFGDGVNIAARLENLADPGGICVSRGVVDHIRGKVDAEFEDLGNRALKNIAEPMQVFRLRIDRPSAGPKPPVESQSIYPSIAVLPIANISGNAELDAFAIGLSEDLVAALAKIPELSVAPRNSSEAFRGRTIDARRAAIELGVRHVLEGRVQGSARRTRITLQMIEGATGTHLWSERFDSEAEDLLALQDEIVRRVVIEVRVKLTTGDYARTDSGGTRDLNALLWYGEGFDEWSKFTRDGNFRARELFRRAHEADPRWAKPLAALSATYREFAIRKWSTSPDKDFGQALELAERAVDLDPNDPTGYIHLGYARIEAGRTKEGVALLEKAVELSPNDYYSLANLALNLPRVGQVTRALSLFARARKLRPVTSGPNLANEAFVLHLAGMHQRAVELLTESLSRADLPDARVRLAAVYTELGRLAEARAEISHLLACEPDATIREYTGNLPFPNRERLEWYAGLLGAAGLPDG